MTRRDYVAIAVVMNENKPDAKFATVAEKRLWAQIMEGLALIMQVNPHFNAERFKAACEGREVVP